MMHFLSISLLFCLFASCNSGQSSSLSADSSLIVLDLSGDFSSSRQIDLHDIADVEYIPLETNENSLLSNVCGCFWISDQYIVTADLNGGNIFFFDRSGKHLRTVNRQGQGNEEYSAASIIIDFEGEECFVDDYFKNKIFVYDFHGTYKRVLPGATFHSTIWYDNYDADFLLGYNKYYNYKTQKCEDESPYYLVSKKDGSMHPVGLHVKDRMSSTVHVDKVDYDGGSSFDRTIFLINPILTNGSDVLIAEFSLDTLYHFKERKLIPVAVRTPSVRATTPPVILNPIIFTDSLFCFEMMPFYYNPSNPTEAYGKQLKLACDRRTGKLERISFYDSCDSRDEEGINMDMAGTKGSLPNIGLCFRNSEGLLERNEKGLLKGRLKDIASKLKADDNKVLVLCKFK